jgi:hypothetical protein
LRHAPTCLSGPFHVIHGHSPLPGEHNAIGKMDFVLEIDGVEQTGQQVTWKDGDVLFHTKLFNYPEGLEPGEYVFTGTWYEPCYRRLRKGQRAGRSALQHGNNGDRALIEARLTNTDSGFGASSSG